MPNLPDIVDTIVAVASAPGSGERGIVRIAGERAADCLATCFATWDGQRLNASRRPRILDGRFLLPPPCDYLEGQLYWWPTHRSYTGQPTAEFHTIGSPPLLDEVVATLCRQGARLARPGEFTLRAFLAGRIDLTQAEAVLGVIEAESGSELQVALSQLAGGITAPLARLRERLLDLLASLEAGLDFVEEDIEFLAADRLQSELREATRELNELTTRLDTRGEARPLPRVVLRGAPNVGKSSLFNALTGHASALVTPIAGTTRDYLMQELALESGRCLLIDTAGVEETITVEETMTGRMPILRDPLPPCPAPVEELAQSADMAGCISVPGGVSAGRLASPALPRAEVTVACERGSSDEIRAAAQRATQEQAKLADLVLFCIDASRPLDDSQRQAAHGLGSAQRGLVVLTKVERDEATRGGTVHVTNESWPAAIATSSREGTGLDDLRQAIARELASGAPALAVVAGTAARCRESLRLATASLQRALETSERGWGDELVAAELRIALDELGQVAGAVYTDDILDRIFSRFCIGK